MRWLTGAAALTFSLPILSAAPAWQADLTPFVAGSQSRLAPCRLNYKATWKGMIDAGTIQMEFGNPANAKAGAYIATSQGQSLGAAAAVYAYKHWFWSEMDPATFRPRLFHSVEDVEKKRVKHTLEYSRKQVTWERLSHVYETGADFVQKGSFAFSPAHDVFSAMLFVRGRKLDNGDDVSFVIQPGESPYLVRVHVDGREAHEGRAAIRLSVAMRKIDQDTLELLPYKKLKRATLWLSDDADRVPLEIRAEVFIGDVRVTLVNQQRL